MCELDFDPDNPETMPDAKPSVPKGRVDNIVMLRIDEMIKELDESKVEWNDGYHPNYAAIQTLKELKKRLTT